MSFSVRIEKLKQPKNASNQDPYHKRKKLREQRGKEPISSSSHLSEMIDIGETSSTTVSQRHHHTTEKEKHKEKKKSPAKQLPQPQLQDNQMLFKTGNPRVEEVCGVIHLFKKIKTVPEEAPACETPEETSSSTTILAGEASPLLDAFKDELPKDRSTKVCVLAVPSFMSVADFCDFIACFKSKMRWIRIVRDDSPNKYMVLLKFDSQKSADSFYLQYNGKQFNSLDPEDCKIVFVSKIEIEEPSSVEPLTPNSATPNGLANVLTEEGTKVVELPTCPVCLDRLDSEVSGIITTMCNHRFHCDCLTKWGDGTCPVCRYSHQVENECGTCGLKDNLWICLTCGNIGCGRYNGGHAREHFEQTGHTYSMEIDSQRVWDYTGDGYVHRLVQNKTDGKFIEIPNPEAKKDAELVEAQFQSKLDSILSEYNSLLANQLSSQRVYFEAMLRNTEKEKDAQIENVLKEARALRAERKNLMTKIEKLEQQLKKEAEDRKFTEQINETLTANQKQFKELNEQQEKKYEKKLQEKDSMIRDLEDQVRDLMLHFETQQKLNSNPNKEEMQGASIVIAPSLTASSSSSGGGKKKKNKKK